MQPVDLIKQIYAHQARGDVDAVVANCHEDVHFFWVATQEVNPQSGGFTGREALKGQMQGLHDLFVYRSFVPVDFIAVGDRVASRAEIHMTRRSTGREFMVPTADFWTIRDGKVAELIEYYDTALIASVLG
jgi:ketosteroid isomerase-like protein